MKELTVVVPTYNRADMIGDCLDTLVRQDVDADRFEVIVVDDGSTDSTAEVVARFTGAPIRIRYVGQQNAGLNVARNRGAELAQAPLIAYLDDDTIVDAGWAGETLAAFDRFGCDAVAGRIILRFDAPKPRWLTEKMHIALSEYDRGAGEPRLLPTDDCPRGANFAVTREMWVRLGGFKPMLDRYKSSLISNGEIEFFERLYAAGGTVAYWPKASVLHRVPADRLTVGFFRRRWHAQGVGDAMLQAKPHAGGRRVQAVREVARMGRALPILVRGLVKGDGLVAADSWIHYCRGRMAGFLRPPFDPHASGGRAS